MNLNIIISKPLLLMLIFNMLCGVVTAESIVFGTDTTIQEGYMVFLGSGRDDSAMESLALGSNYIQVDNIRIGVSNLIDNMYFNVSYVNELGNNRSVGERLLEYNVTYTGGQTTFFFTGNSSNDNMMYDLLVDNVVVRNDVGPHTFTYTRSSWSTHRFTLLAAGYAPDPPFHGFGNYSVADNTVNLTWSRGNFSNREIVTGRSDRYANSPSDGTVWYNGTNMYHNFTVNETQFFSVFSYNDSTGLYSTGLDIPWGAIRMQCFNETALPDTVAINFDVQISNSDLTLVYTGSDLSNPTYISFDDIPYGDDTLFVVSNSSGYSNKQYTYDLEVNTYYNFSFWLPLEAPSGGGTPSEDDDTEYSENYVITVVGPQGEFGNDPPLEDVNVHVKRYINETETYQDVGVYVTDANGQFQIALIPGKTYYFTMTKTGYETEVSSWVPPEIEFTDDRYHTFRMTPTSGEGQVDYDIFWETITFTGTMEKHKGLNYTGNITITYSDSNSSTINTQCKLSEIFNETKTVIQWYNETTDSWTVIIYGVNITRTHMATLWFNNTANFETSSPVSIMIPNIETYVPGVVPFDLQGRTENIFGDLPFFVVAAISAVVGIIALCAFGPYNTSLGIVMCGVSMSIVQAVGSAFGNPLPNVVLLVIPFIIAIGIIHFYTKDPGGHT